MTPDHPRPASDRAHDTASATVTTLEMTWPILIPAAALIALAIRGLTR